MDNRIVSAPGNAATAAADKWLDEQTNRITKAQLEHALRCIAADALDALKLAPSLAEGLRRDDLSERDIDKMSDEASSLSTACVRAWRADLSDRNDAARRASLAAVWAARNGITSKQRVDNTAYYAVTARLIAGDAKAAWTDPQPPKPKEAGK